MMVSSSLDDLPLHEFSAVSRMKFSSSSDRGLISLAFLQTSPGDGQPFLEEVENISGDILKEALHSNDNALLSFTRGSLRTCFAKSVTCGRAPSNALRCSGDIVLSSEMIPLSKSELEVSLMNLSMYDLSVLSKDLYEPTSLVGRREEVSALLSIGPLA